MATGLPVIVTDRPSNREWVEEGINGRLTRYGDAVCLSDALLEMARLDATRRAEIARRNRAVIEARADWKRNIAKLLGAYERISTREEVLA
jgi:glycosyltransferase involved in cell wall biosynthesis